VGKGTGLGLSVAYGIIQKHGGDIIVDSDGRSRTTFHIQLPIVAETETTGTPIMKLKRPVDGAFRVLIVEDENNLRQLMRDILVREGYLADEASSGERAVEMLAENIYHAVVSDMKMPGMTGMHLYGIIQDNHPKLTSRVLFITGDVLGRETQEFLKKTGAPYIEKPFHVNIFLSHVHNMLTSEA
jgi:CheY-like chemotaxis protein